MNLDLLKDVFHQLSFRPKKHLGQNFLIHEPTAERFVASLPDRELPIVEIGGGFGALTSKLIPHFKNIIVLEPDPRLYTFLSKQFEDEPHVTLEEKSVLKVSFGEYLTGGSTKLTVVGNLPFAITSPILIHLIEERSFIKSALLTVQREVAQRLYAKPRTKAYSPLSCLLQCYTEMTPQFQIPRNAFYPAPEVVSEVVAFRFLEKPKVSPQNMSFMFQVIRTGFNKRRKMLANALLDLGEDYSKELLHQAFEGLGLAKTARAEELTLQDFSRLSDALQEVPKSPPSH